MSRGKIASSHETLSTLSCVLAGAVVYLWVWTLAFDDECDLFFFFFCYTFVASKRMRSIPTQRKRKVITKGSIQKQRVGTGLINVFFLLSCHSTNCKQNKILLKQRMCIVFVGVDVIYLGEIRKTLRCSDKSNLDAEQMAPHSIFLQPG